MLFFSACKIITNETKNISTVPWWLDAAFIQICNHGFQFLLGTFFFPSTLTADTRHFCFISAFRLRPISLLKNPSVAEQEGVVGGISAELFWRGVMLERSKIVKKKKKKKLLRSCSREPAKIAPKNYLCSCRLLTPQMLRMLLG